MPPKQPKVFISYAREDALVARRLFDDLKKAGAEPWLDVENILPGQRWEAQIDKAIKKTDFVIALLSSASLQKRGYVQKEVRSALSVLDEIPENVVYLIPARLDDCKPEDKKLRELNQVDLFPFYEIGLQIAARHQAGTGNPSRSSRLSIRRRRPGLSSDRMGRHLFKR